MWSGIEWSECDVTKKLEKAWESLARDQKAAALSLREHGLHGPSIGRAYYAAYSELTSALIGQGQTSFGKKFKNPEHASLPQLAQNGLRSLGLSDRRTIASTVRRMRSRREDADYRPLINLPPRCRLKRSRIWPVFAMRWHEGASYEARED